MHSLSHPPDLGSVDNGMKNFFLSKITVIPVVHLIIAQSCYPWLLVES